MNEQSDKTARNLREPNHQSVAVVSASNNNKNMFKGQNNENENETQSDETEEFLTKEAGKMNIILEVCDSSYFLK